jgi:hypothetical protein
MANAARDAPQSRASFAVVQGRAISLCIAISACAVTGSSSPANSPACTGCESSVRLRSTSTSNSSISRAITNSLPGPDTSDSVSFISNNAAHVSRSFLSTRRVPAAAAYRSATALAFYKNPSTNPWDGATDNVACYVRRESNDQAGLGAEYIDLQNEKAGHFQEGEVRNFRVVPGSCSATSNWARRIWF